MTFTSPYRTIIVEPVEAPAAPEPDETPVTQPDEPPPVEPAPPERVPEPVPAEPGR